MAGLVVARDYIPRDRKDDNRLVLFLIYWNVFDGDICEVKSELPISFMTFFET